MPVAGTARGERWDWPLHLVVAFGLAVFVMLTYVVVVGAGYVIGAPSPHGFLFVLATTVIAVAYRPVQVRFERSARRLLRRTPSPYEVLRRFAQTVDGEHEDVLDRIARLVAQATGAPWAQVWLRVGDDLRLSASWPNGAGAVVPPQPARDLVDASGAGLRCAEVREGGRLLGVIRLAESADNPLTPAEQRLLQGVAAQSGLALQGIRLNVELAQRVADLTARSDELKRSRIRVIGAQDTERRRLERNIHDGAQQHLVALAVNLRLAETIARRSPEREPQLLAEQASAAREAAAVVATLSSGIYPQRLRDEGLVPALCDHLAVAPFPVRVTDAGMPRPPAEIENALYFCALEAVQNATKHSEATHATVELSAAANVVRLSVADDGAGFRPTAQAAGLTNMRDRVDAIGGTITITSSPGRGTRLDITVPT
jgi:signal transduction histidine kinase